MDKHFSPGQHVEVAMFPRKWEPATVKSVDAGAQLVTVDLNGTQVTFGHHSVRASDPDALSEMPNEITPANVDKCVDLVRRNTDDPEVAGGLEAYVYTGALEWIVKNSTDKRAAGLAVAALKTMDLKFPRWSA